MISRRTFLAGTSAVAITPMLPTLSVAEAAPIVAELPKTTIWVGGHYGEFDWHPFNAESKIDALRQLLHYHGWEEARISQTLSLRDDALAKELSSAEIDVQRVELMDGIEIDSIKPHHWIRAGLGSSCSRCDCECFTENGARAVGEEAVCEECLTLADKLELGDHDDVEEELIELMMDHECEEAELQQVLARDMDPSLIPPAMWQKCLAAARAEL